MPDILQKLNASDRLTIQQAAKILKVSTKTLRRWETQGLIIPERTPGNQRRYNRYQLENIGKAPVLKSAKPVEEHVAAQTPVSEEQAKLQVHAPKSMWIAAAGVLAVVAVLFATHPLTSNASSTVKSIFTKIANFSPSISNDESKNLAAITNDRANITSGSVLAGETVLDDFVFAVNVPATFAKDATVSGKLTAPNIVYSINAGSGITITGDKQTPTISAATSGLDFFNAIKVAGQSDVVASGNNDVFTLAAGSNVSITTDATNKKITITSTDTDTVGLTGTVGVENGGTGLTTYTTGDILYASADNTLAKLAVGTANQVLSVSGGVPTWTTSSSSCVGGCVGLNPSATQTISPASATVTGLVVAQAPSGSVDTFQVTNNSGATKYLYVDSTGILNVNSQINFPSAGTIKSTSTSSLTLDSGTTGDVNLGTGNSPKTVNIATGTGGNITNISTDNSTADTVNIGSSLDTTTLLGTILIRGATTINDTGATATNIGTGSSSGAITIGRTSSTNLILNDADWNISGAGAANFASIGGTTRGTGAFTTLAANSTVTLSGLGSGSGTNLCVDGSNNVVTCSGATGITGAGTTNKLSKFTSSSVIGDALISDDGTTISWSTGATTQSALSVTANSLTTGKVSNFVGSSAPTTNTATTQNLFDVTYAQSTNANTNGFTGLAVNFTNNPSVAGNTEYAARIQNQVTTNTTDNAVSALLLLDNADTSGTGSTVVTDALRITNSGAIGSGINNGITFGSTTIGTGLNFSSTPTTNYVSGSNWTVSAAGAETLASTLQATAGTFTTGNVAITAGALTLNGTTRISNAGVGTLVTGTTIGTQTFTTNAIADSGALSISSATSNAITIDSGTTGNVNIGTGSSGKTINIATDNTNADTLNLGSILDTTNISGTVNIGTGSNTSVITLGRTTNTDLVLNDANWNITGAGAANFASVGATTRGTGAFTTLAANSTVTFSGLSNSTGTAVCLDGSNNLITCTAGNGAITGSGSTNTLSKFTASGTIGDSNITDNGTTVSIAAGKNFTLADGVGTFTQTYSPLGTTASANGLTVAPKFTLDATDQTLSSIYVNPNTNSNNDTGDILYGINLDSITGSSATETAIRVGTGWDNIIGSANFNVTQAGALTSVGVDAGSGALQGTGGLTLTGTANINTTGSATTTLGSTSSTNLVLNDADWNITGAGAANFASIGATTRGTGAFTTLDANSTVTLSGLSSGSGTSLCVDGSNNVVTCTASGSISGSGAANQLTYWSGASTLTGNAGATIDPAATTGNTLAITNAGLTSGKLTNFTSTNNSAANTAWTANLFTANNAQGTTAVSTGSIYGFNLDFNQNTSVSGNTETAARIGIKQNDSSSTDAAVSSILSLENDDTATGNQITASKGLNIDGSNITDGIYLNGTFGTNLINSSTGNFVVTQAGALTTTNVAISSGVLSLNGTTRIDNTGIGSFVSNTTIASQTFTTNNIADSGALTIKSATSNALTLDSGTTGTINIGTGSSGKTVNIATDNTNADTLNIGSVLDTTNISGTVNIGTGSNTGTITIGRTSNTDLALNDANWSITGAGTATFSTLSTGVVINSSGTLSSEAQLAVSRGGTGTSSLTSNGVLLGNGSSAVSATTAGTNGQLLLGVTSSAPAFASMSGDATITNAGVLTIGADTVALTTDTTGNYVATITAGNGISGSSSTEGGTPTIALSALSSDWDQTGAFDIILDNASSELKLLESAGATFFGSIDVGDLSANRTYTFPDETGTVCLTSGNCSGVGGSVSSAGGTINTLAKFSSSSAIADSNITDDGSTVSIAAGKDFSLADGVGKFTQTYSPLGTTTSANGLTITPKFTLNAADQTLSALYINPNTNSNNDTGDILYGVNVDDITGSSAAEYGLRIGSGYDAFAYLELGSTDLKLTASAPSGATRAVNIPAVSSDDEFCIRTLANCFGGGGGGITGSGVANQVAYWSSGSAIAGNAGYTIDPAATTGTTLALSNTGLTTGKLTSFTATSTPVGNTATTQNLFDTTFAQTTTANTNGFTGLGVNFTNNPSVAGNTEYAARIQNQVTTNTTDNAVSALLLLDNADTNATGSTVVTDALRITNSGAISAGITNGITFGSPTISNGINFSSDPASKYINSTNFNVTTAGAMTLASSLQATAGTFTTGDVAITSGALTLGGTTRITNAGVGTLITGTVIGSQTFTTNNIADSGALTIKSATSNALTLDSGTTGTVNIGTGTSGKTINIATDNTNADTLNLGSVLDTTNISGTINIGTGSNTGVITLGRTSNTDLVLNDANWNITGAGAANFASIGATTRGSGAFTTLDANSTVTLSGLSSGSGSALCLDGSNNVVTCASGSAVTGSGAAGRIAYWSSASALTSSANFTVDPTATTGNAFALTDANLTTGKLTNFTSTTNSAANTAWSANQFNVTNAQGTTAVSTGSIAGLDLQFTQGTSVSGNTETALRINLAQNDSSTTDATVASLVDIANNDTSTGNQATVTDGLKITGTNITNGIDLSGTFGTNLITATNFNVTQAGILSLITGYSQASGNFAISGSGTFGTGTGAISLNGDTTLAADKSLTLASGTGVITQTYAPAGTLAAARGTILTPTFGIDATDQTLAGLYINPNTNGNADAGDSLNGINIAAITGTVANETAILIGSAGGGSVGWNNILVENGTVLINGSGVVQSAAISGSYTGITGTGALDAGSITSNFGAIDVGADNITTTGTVFGNNHDRSTSGALTFGNTNATSVSICNSANCDTIDIGTNTDADAITIGDTLDSLAIASTGLNVSTGGALTGVASIDTIATSATTLTFAGAGTISSTTTSALTLDTGTTGTLNLGTGTSGKTINIGTSNSNADTINIASALDTTTVAGAVKLTGLSAGSGNAICLDGGNALVTCTVGSGGVSGSGVANQITYFSGASAVTGNANFTFNPASTTGNTLALANTSLTTGSLANFTATSTPTGAASTSNGVTLDLTESAGTNATTYTGLNVKLTSSPTVAGNTEYAAQIQNQVTTNTTDNAVAALLLLDNADTNATGSTVVTDALRITNSGAISAGITNGITFGSTTISNGINFSSDPASKYINSTNFNVTSAGAATLASTLQATAGTFTTGNVAITSGGLTLGGTTRIDNTGVGTFITGTVIGSQTFTTNNIADSGALTIKSATSNDLTLDSGTTGIVNLGVGNNAKTLNIATGNAGDIINIATNNTVADTVNIGSALDTLTFAGTTGITGATSINVSGSSNTNIGTGSSTGTITLGRSSGTDLALNDSQWSITGAGAGSLQTLSLTGLSAQTGSQLCITGGNVVGTCSSGSGVSGSGVANQLTYWSSATAITGNSGATLDPTATTGTTLALSNTALTTGKLTSFTGTSTPVANTATTQNLFDTTFAQGTTANTNGFVALGVNFTSNPTVSGNTEYAARIQNQVTTNTTDNAVSALLLLDNADTNGTGSTVVTDALRITNSGAIATGVTNGINFGSTSIANGLNFSATPATNYVTGTNWSITAAGAETLGSTITATTGSVLGSQTFTTNNIADSGALTIKSATSNALTLDSGTTGTVNLGTGTSGKIINIGTDNTNADTINIGSVLDTTALSGTLNIGTGSNTGVITLGRTTNTDLVLNDANWNITGAGAANFASIGAVTPGTGAFTTLSSTGTTTLGNGTATVAIDSSDWDISATGDASNIGAIGMDGDLTNTQATPSLLLVDSTGASDDYSINVDGSAFNVTNDTDSRTELNFIGDGGIDLGDNTTTKTIDIGGNTVSAADTIRIASNSTAADTITIGNSNASTTTAITGGTAWSVSTAGLITTADDIAVNGGDLTTSAATFNVANAATTLNLGSTNITRTINLGTGTGADTINIGTGGTTADTINLGNSGSTTALNFTSGTGAQTFNSSVVSGSGASSAFNFNANSMTTGAAFMINANAITSGNGLYLSSTSTSSSFTGNLGLVEWAPGSSTTATSGDIFQVNIGANGTLTTGNIFNVTDASTSLFTVNETQITSALPHQFTAAGDVGIAYDINFTNQVSSYIKSNASLTIQSGESFESNNLTLQTFGSGRVVFDVNGTANGGVLISNNPSAQTPKGLFMVSGTATNNALAIFNETAGTHNIITASAAGTERFRVNNAGNTFVTLRNTATFGVCHVTNGAGFDELTDCSGSVGADYMEMYPVASDASEKGTIVTIGQNTITTTTGENMKQLVKTTNAYQSNVIGIISDKSMAGDFNSTGYNIAESDNPQPVALSGRVQVKVDQNSSSIHAGDFITTSTTPGMAMKANKPGFMVGKALEDWTPNSNNQTVLVYVNNTWADPNQTLAFDDNGNLVVAGQITAQDIKITDTTNQIDSIKSTIADLNEKVASISAELTNLQSNNGNSGALPQDQNWALSTDSGRLTTTLAVQVPDLSVTGKMTVGTLKFDDVLSDISSITGELSLNNGVVKIDEHGNMNVEGTVTAKAVSTEKINVLGTATTSASLGKSIIPTGIKELVIETTAVSTSSSVFVTPEIPVAIAASATESGKFVVRLPSIQLEDVKFNWWIIN